MSLLTLIEEARAAGRYDGETLVIFPGGPSAIRLTLTWDRAGESWRAEASDESYHQTCLAPKGVTAEAAISRAMDGLLDSRRGVVKPWLQRIEWQTRERV